MQTLKFTEFKTLNESNLSKDILYRNTSERFLLEFLENKKITGKNKFGFLSFSKDPNSGFQHDYSIGTTNTKFGNVRISFSREILEKQGSLIEVEYTPEFFENNPILCKYITNLDGYEAHKEDRLTGNYKSDFEGYSKKIIDEMLWEDWGEYLDGLSKEEEVILTKEMLYENGLIVLVEFENKPENKRLLSLLEENSIEWKIE